MKHSTIYNIQFKGLKLGVHQFNYLVEKEFFDFFKYDDFIDCNIKVNLEFVKKSTFFELFFTHNGTVLLNCDVSGEEFNQQIKGSLKMIIEFGDDFNNDNDEILIISHNDYELDISQFIYESIILSVPIKRIHPGILDGTLKSKAIEKLTELQDKNKNKIDPRWDKLKELIKDKKS